MVNTAEARTRGHIARVQPPAPGQEDLTIFSFSSQSTLNNRTFLWALERDNVYVSLSSGLCFLPREGTDSLGLPLEK